MPTHAHFEELCVLAMSGQLSAVESDLLNQHLVNCDNCRMFLKDARFISNQVIPQALHSFRAEARVPAGLRERFLARAASQGLKIQAGPPNAAATPASQAGQQEKPALSPRKFLRACLAFAALRPAWTWAIAGSACLACFALGMAIRISYEAGWRGGSAQNAVPTTSPQETKDAAAVHLDAQRLRAFAAERDRLDRQTADLDEQLRAAQKEKQEAESRLQQQLAAAESNAAHDHQVLSQQAAALNTRAANLQSQLAAARQQASLTAAALQRARATTSEYAARLDLTQAQLRSQERMSLPDPNEVSSLVAARNLHIVDVYDSTNGKRGHASGRVFYVEGRSLVFYAYDLATPRAQKNISFHLWGAKVGDEQVTLSLGVLHDDDPRDRRWALTCSDPAVLAKINSVYVTAERPGKPSNTPRGPRVLYAYFGTPPNHP